MQIMGSHFYGFSSSSSSTSSSSSSSSSYHCDGIASLGKIRMQRISGILSACNMQIRNSKLCE